MRTYAPSLLDKLLGDAHEAPGRTGVSPRFGVEQIKDSVARDIERVLNAHAPFQPEDLAGFPQAAQSLLTLGLGDIASKSLASDRDRAAISQSIGRVLAEHDRRLSHVEVRVRPGGAGMGGLTFSIHARLKLHPSEEAVVFDAVMQPGSQRYAVANSDPRARGQAASHAAQASAAAAQSGEPH